MIRRARLAVRKSAELSRLPLSVDCANDSQSVDEPTIAPKAQAFGDSRATSSPPEASRSADLYQALRPEIVRIARAVLGANPPADLVHDTCVDVALSKSHFRGDCAFSTWMYAVVRHHVHNWMRKERSYRNLIHAVEQAWPFNRVQRPDEVVDGFALADQLRAAISVLTESERACLLLVRYECLSPREVAARLDITPSAVRMNIHRARTRLRTRLGTEDGDASCDYGARHRRTSRVARG
jgi:RNA polymerase sigma factor (sigma-70 family)